MSETVCKPRRWWLAALLVAAQPTGFLYVGKPVAFFLFYTFGILSYVIFYVGTVDWFARANGIFTLVFISFIAFLFFAIAPIWIATRQKNYSLKWYNRWYIYFLTVAATCLFAFSPELLGFTKKIETYYFSSTSMMPTIMPGDYLIADQRNSVPAEVAAGDVVVARFSHKKNVPHVLRVIGLAGDRVRLVNGVPEINGGLLKQETVGQIDVNWSGESRTVEIRREYLPSGRSYLVTHHAERASRRNTGIFKIGPDEFFILGDNRQNAIDSTIPRPDGFGLMMRSEISGVVTGIYWSSNFERIGQRIDTISQ